MRVAPFFFALAATCPVHLDVLRCAGQPLVWGVMAGRGSDGARVLHWPPETVFYGLPLGLGRALTAAPVFSPPLQELAP